MRLKSRGCLRFDLWTVLFYKKARGNGFGRAVSRILSSPLRMERIICLSSRYPEPVPRWRDRSGPLRGSLFGLAPDGVFRAASLALRAVRSYRTFSPSPTVAAVCDRRASGAHRAPLQFRLSVFCGTVRRKTSRFSSRVYLCFATVRDRRYKLRGIAPFGVRTFLFWLAPKAILHPSKTNPI